MDRILVVELPTHICVLCPSSQLEREPLQQRYYWQRSIGDNPQRVQSSCGTDENWQADALRYPVASD